MIKKLQTLDVIFHQFSVHSKQNLQNMIITLWAYLTLAHSEEFFFQVTLLSFFTLLHLVLNEKLRCVGTSSL